MRVRIGKCGGEEAQMCVILSASTAICSPSTRNCEHVSQPAVLFCGHALISSGTPRLVPSRGRWFFMLVPLTVVKPIMPFSDTWLLNRESTVVLWNCWPTRSLRRVTMLYVFSSHLFLKWDFTADCLQWLSFRLDLSVFVPRMCRVTWLQERRGPLWTLRVVQLATWPVPLRCAVSPHLVRKHKTSYVHLPTQAWCIFF